MVMGDWRIHPFSPPPTVFLFSCTCTLLIGYSTSTPESSSSSSSAVVTLDSIELFKTHDWLATTPTGIYFQCKGEKETVLPDVKAKHTLYTFKGQESWQPLTELTDIKCKRCGLYQKDSIKSNHEFDEWELCASDFTRSDGRYIHFKDKEFNATFICPDCVPLGTAADYSVNLKTYLNWILIPVISIAVAIIVIAGLVAACKYWQKRRRQQEQARFLKLFEDGDDIEDELGIGPLSNSI
ncbi:uncharacterized protein LOC127264234 isoform X2 [Andrographis paniculata]|uniref:uncharacterized protein LOC127264234 isoform X2 n=1 Tax=Andrographis paniculata TaxID=175694 RepID=UPI0021E7A904|nr:uncharacterized protein LOC127264234 isoform X2 [Andrographis paniculata]